MTNLSELVPLKPSQLIKAVTVTLAAGRSALIHGDPGIGKSAMVRQIADAQFASAYGYSFDLNGMLHNETGAVTNYRPWFRDVRAAQLDPTDLRGLPGLNGDDFVHWKQPEFLPRDARGGIFFADEMNRGTEMVRNAMLQFALDGTIGDYRKPETWYIVSAVNDDDIGVSKMSSALQARFVHLDAVADLDDVCKFAINPGAANQSAVPFTSVRSPNGEWEPVVIAFLRFRSELLHVYDRKARVSPNPRAWEFVSQIVSQNPAPEIEFALIAGTVGRAAAIEFCAFLRLFRSLPSIDAILMNPTGADVPTQADVLYAISSALARRASDKNWARVLTYLDRLPVEYNVFAVRDACRRVPALQSYPESTKWFVAHSDVTM